MTALEHGMPPAGGHRHRHRPAADGAHRRAVAARPDPVPAPPAREPSLGRLRRRTRRRRARPILGRARRPCSHGSRRRDAMDEQAAIERIRSVPLFSGFGDKELQRVAAIAKEVEFPAGKDIAKQGESRRGVPHDPGRRGRVSVDGVEHATLGPGSYFGEISLIDGGPRSATVTAKTDLKTRVADVMGLQRAAGPVPRAAQARCSKQLCGRLRDVGAVDLALAADLARLTAGAGRSVASCRTITMSSSRVPFATKPDAPASPGLRFHLGIRVGGQDHDRQAGAGARASVPSHRTRTGRASRGPSAPRRGRRRAASRQAATPPPASPATSISSTISRALVNAWRKAG